MNTNDPLLEVSVVAKRLKKHPETVCRYIRSGKLRAVRPGTNGNWLVPESALAAFMASATRTARGRPFSPTSPNIFRRRPA